MAHRDGLLADGERVLMETRRHPLFLSLRLVLWALAALVLAGLGIWAAVSYGWPLAILAWVIALFPLTIGLVRFLKWRSERFLVTTRRVMQISGVLGRRVFDSSLNQVNDILLTQSLFGRMLDFGNLEIITGNDAGLNRLTGIARPVEFKRTVVEARDDVEDGHAMHGLDNTVQLLAALNELRDSGMLSPTEYEAKRRQLVGDPQG
ncbi:MAG TPA: PH domain-containing protein [Thermomicrobiaceae bacterium]|nr:PH domain-containing protein [Thermomicrobiaceae bacterium]